MCTYEGLWWFVHMYVWMWWFRHVNVMGCDGLNKCMCEYDVLWFFFMQVHAWAWLALRFQACACMNMAGCYSLWLCVHWLIPQWCKRLLYSWCSILQGAMCLGLVLRDFCHLIVHHMKHLLSIRSPPQHILSLSSWQDQLIITFSFNFCI